VAPPSVLRYRMVLDLHADPPASEWAKAAGPPGVRFAGLDAVPDEALVPAWAAAYPPEHPDHVPGEVAIEYLREILSGREIGPPLAAGRVALAASGAVGAVLLTQAPPNPAIDWPGGAFVADLFRDPAPRWAGLGGALLRRGIAAAAAEGAERVGLSVTDGNPARRLYAALGFRVTGVRTVTRPG
jgi:GNAT superfamily N-acetyltransferase